jgi:hypothetical protein
MRKRHEKFRGNFRKNVLTAWMRKLHENFREKALKRLMRKPYENFREESRKRSDEEAPSNQGRNPQKARWRTPKTIRKISR